MKERIRWIDWAKTICMFLVILGHCHLSDTYNMITILIYTFHMPLFFYLSGLLSTSKNRNNSLKKDFKYIIIPYLTYGILSILINAILSHRFSFTIFIKDIYELIVGYNSSIGPIWFLPALFICRRLFYLFILFNHRKYAKILFSIVVLFPIYFICNYNINLPFFADSGICALPFFYFGHESSIICKKISNINPKTQAILMIILFFIFAFAGPINGSVILAECIYGNNIILYYFNAIIGISIIILISIAIENKIHKIAHIMAYGSIVTLGFHGHILLFLHYYIPIAFGYYTPTYSLLIAILYSTIVYTICLALIITIDKTNYSHIFGLKSKLKLSLMSPNK